MIKIYCLHFGFVKIQCGLVIAKPGELEKALTCTTKSHMS